jgi:hypothetical protein
MADFQDGTSESQWQRTRMRDSGDVNADVLNEIAAGATACSRSD